MHIIIGLLTAVAGLVWALYRLQNSGVDLNSFNPFHWARRRRWEKQLGTRPLHRLENPMEAAAALVVGMAELRGTVTRETKERVTSLFASEFRISGQEAADLYAASSYLLRDVVNMPGEVKAILKPTLGRYEVRHQQSLMSMLAEVARTEGTPTGQQEKLLAGVEQSFAVKQQSGQNW